MIYKIFNIISKTLRIIFKIAILPILILFFPLFVVIGFISTDWNDDWDRDYYIKQLKGKYFW